MAIRDAADRRCGFPATRFRGGSDGSDDPSTDAPTMHGSSVIESSTSDTLRSITVADVMNPGLISCAPATPLRSVARLMAKFAVHAVFVFDYGDEDDEAKELWGLVSDLDLVAGAWADLGGRTAGGSAVTPLVTVGADEPLERASELMATYGTSHLAVLDPESGRPVGVLSTLDIARVIADS
jgi:CBS domain-containing protein